jgi:hypothetical protein
MQSAEFAPAGGFGHWSAAVAARPGPLDAHEVRAVRAADDGVIDVRIADVAHRRRRRHGGIPLQERSDAAVERAAELPADGVDVLRVADPPHTGGRAGILLGDDLVLAVRMGDRVGRAGLEALVEEAHAAERDLLALGGRVRRERALERERRDGAAAAREVLIGAGGHVEDLGREVVGERDRRVGIRRLVGERAAERVARVEARLEADVVVVLVPSGKAVGRADRSDGSEVAGVRRRDDLGERDDARGAGDAQGETERERRAPRTDSRAQPWMSAAG